jgi:hypothetical protein
MTLMRRYLVILALMFWVGGFMFYGAVTVPVVRGVLNPDPAQSKITRQVTAWMNLSGTLALLVFFVDLYGSPVRPRSRRALAWASMTVAHMALFWMHRKMSHQMDDPHFYRLRENMAHFQSWHRVYMWISTFQWASAMAFAALSIMTWRQEDRLSIIPESGPGPAASPGARGT